MFLRLVTGHDFSRADYRQNSGWALQAAEKLAALKGHDFSRAACRLESMMTLVTEGCFPTKFQEFSLFPQPV
jgi:hypothetical protein